MSGQAPIQDADERKLAELGYKQELGRTWTSFQNMAISFTIISVLAGCFTTFGFAWNNGGPIAISWGWPIVCAILMCVALSMSELTSAFPTAGGPYWWASRMGGAGWAWFTGWFNVIGLVAVVASVDYAAAIFATVLFGLWGLNLGFVNFADPGASILGETFIVYIVFLIIHGLINVYSSQLVARLNAISVWWHVIGVAVIIAILIIVPDRHQSVSFVFTETNNLSGFGDGLLWFYILPLGLLMTMYTVTGYDASAHVAEETHEAEMSAAKGIWQAVLLSAIIGWFVLLAIVFAIPDKETANGVFGFTPGIFDAAMPGAGAELVILISTIGQLFCGMACVTSCSRTFFAFSRDRATPGWKTWSKVDKNHVPRNAVIGSSVAALILTLPALYDHPDLPGIPVAFYAIVSIAVIGLYIAYVAPVFLRLRAGDSFKTGAWNLGSKYKVLGTVAVVWTVFAVVIFNLPFYPQGVPGNEDFSWVLFNYSPIMTVGLFIVIGIWWLVSAKNKFTGPVRTIEFDEAMRVMDEGSTSAPPATPPPAG